MEPLQTHGATCEAVDSATAGTLPSPGVPASMLGECEAMDSATAGTLLSPGVPASILGECEAMDSATAGTLPSPGVPASMLGECEAMDSATAGTLLSPGAPASMLGECEAMDSATAGTLLSPGAPASMLGECEAMDSATAGTIPSPGVPASMLGECKIDIKCEIDDISTLGESLTSEIHLFVKDEPTSSPRGVSLSVPGENLTRLEFYNALVARCKLIRNMRPKHLSNDVRLEILTSLLGEEYESAIQSHCIKVQKIVYNFINKCEKRYSATYFKPKRFMSKNKDWLSKKMFVDLNRLFTTEEHEYTSLSPSQQSRSTELRERLEEEPRSKLVKTFSETVIQPFTSITTRRTTTSRYSYNTAIESMEHIINTCSENPAKAIELSELLVNPPPAPEPFSVEEALSFIIDHKLSAFTYNQMRLSLLSRGHPAYPPYYKVIEYKNNCYPEEVTATEIEAYVTLQSLIDHTFKRIVKCCEPVIESYCQQNGLTHVECDFFLSWGFDGSTGQSLYEQQISQSDPSVNENSFFATTLVPLRVTIGKLVIWNNPSPTSYRFCRPLRIQYGKESRDLILSEKANVEKEINSLLPSTTATSNGNVVASSRTHLTLSLIDGKKFNIISNANSQLSCPICNIAASDFNNLELVFSKPCDPSTLQHGIAPLHAWIRVLEFLLDLAYKNDPFIRDWRIRKNTAKTQLIEQRKKAIKEMLWQRLGLLVDVVKPNAGITNDVITARTALSDENRKLFGEILGLQPWLLDDLHTILVAISCGLPIDATKFGDFAKEVAIKYVTEYNWHPMTVTIHKLFVHGQIKQSILPVGLLPEQAEESRNQLLRSDREHDMRKLDRRKTMSDLFHRALETSDPVISSIRLQERQNSWKRFALSNRVRSLLENEEDPLSFSTPTDDDGEFSSGVTEDFVSSDKCSGTILLTREVNRVWLTKAVI